MTVPAAMFHHADAAQVPARLHLPASRAANALPHLHGHPDHVSGHPLGHQDHQEHLHRLPSHGQCTCLPNPFLCNT